MLSIDCQQLSFCRGGRNLLNEINFDLASGQMLALLGHNGAGKSTLIKLILGLTQPDSGNLSVLGKPAGTQPLSIGYLPENVSFYDNMSVRALLRYFADLKGVNKQRVGELLNEFGLDQIAHQKLNCCSKGQRQRLGLAQALLTDPKLLLLDEPTVGLDPAASALMYQHLNKLKAQGCSILICTHELSLVEPYFDKALLLVNGNLEAQGSLAELRQQAALPVTITLPSDFSFDQIATDNELSHYYSQAQLAFPESELSKVVGLLTKKYQCFDFQIHKADLGMLFRHFVLSKRPSI